MDTRYNTTTRAQGEGELRAEVLIQLLADVPPNAVIEIIVSDTQREDLRWWFTARWAIERDYLAEAQAEADREKEDPNV